MLGPWSATGVHPRPKLQTRPPPTPRVPRPSHADALHALAHLHLVLDRLVRLEARWVVLPQVRLHLRQRHGRVRQRLQLPLQRLASNHQLPEVGVVRRQGAQLGAVVSHTLAQELGAQRGGDRAGEGGWSSRVWKGVKCKGICGSGSRGCWLACIEWPELGCRMPEVVMLVPTGGGAGCTLDWVAYTLYIRLRLVLTSESSHVLPRADSDRGAAGGLPSDSDAPPANAPWPCVADPACC